MSFKKANEGRVNPNYNSKEPGYRMNCQTCVACFEARLRGYDVEAMPFSYEDENILNLGYNPTLAYIDTTTGKNPTMQKINVSNTYDCLEWLDKNVKKGERYAFGYTHSYGKHIIQVSKTLLGKISFYDPQQGKKLKQDILKDIVLEKDNPYNPIIFRIDDKELNIELFNKICKPTKKGEN